MDEWEETADESHVPDSGAVRPPRPKTLIAIWLVVLFMVQPIALYVFNLGSSPFGISFWIFYSVSSLFSVARIAVCWWLALLRPHSKLSVLVPIAVEFAPSLLAVVWGMLRLVFDVGAVDWRSYFWIQICYRIVHLCCAGVLLYLLSLATGLQLVRAGDKPKQQELRVSSLMLATFIIALAFATIQLLPAQESVLFGGEGWHLLSAVFGLQIALAWFAIGLAWWKRSRLWILLACLANAVCYALLMGLWMWMTSRQDDDSIAVSYPPLWSTIVYGAFMGLGFVAAIAITQACGYRLARSTRPSQPLDTLKTQKESTAFELIE